MDPSPPSSVGVERRALGVFLAIAFGFAWATQLLLAWLEHHLQDPMAKAVMPLALAIPLMYPPALGAFVARRYVERGPLGDLGFAWPRRWGWLLVALAVCPLLIGLALLASVPFAPVDAGLSQLSAAITQANKPIPAFLTPGRILALQVVAGLTIAPFFPNGLAAFGEELGWRGYLLPRLQQAWGPWRGLWAHGAIWGFWHAPMILTIGYNYPHHPRLGVPLFIVFCALLGVVFGWLQQASGSILIPTLAHGSVNALAGLPKVLLLPFEELKVGMVFSVVGCAVLALAVAGISRTRGFQVHVLGRPD